MKNGGDREIIGIGREEKEAEERWGKGKGRKRGQEREGQRAREQKREKGKQTARHRIKEIQHLKGLMDIEDKNLYI